MLILIDVKLTIKSEVMVELVQVHS